MAISEETRLVIKDTAHEVAEIVCKRYEEKSNTVIKLHEANCPGRRMGKGTTTIISAVMAGIGASIVLLIRHLLFSA